MHKPTFRQNTRVCVHKSWSVLAATDNRLKQDRDGVKGRVLIGKVKMVHGKETEVE